MALSTSFLDNLYQRSPIWVQQAMIAVYGWYWYRQRYNGYFHLLVAEFRERDSWPEAAFQDYQERQLSVIFQAARRAPHYQKVFAEAGIGPGDFAWDTLKKLPYLTKDTLRKQPRDLLTTQPIPSQTRIFKSSGTTGTPTEIYYTPRFHAWELAVPAVRNLGWGGVDYRRRRVMFGVRKVCRYDQNKPPFWRFSPVENMAYASIYHLSPENMSHYLDFLRMYHPAIVMGYPSSLYTIARYALETGSLPPPAKGVFTTSETVTSKIRETLESVWQCKVYDRYGAVENCLFASQCEYGRYHVSPDVGLLEIVDRNGNACPPGVMGEVICTGLQNTLQPLIRYRIGDVACWAVDQDCPCGRSMPIIEGVEGRFEDICYSPDGREMLRFDTVFKGVEAICEAQVVQKELDLFLIRVVPTDKFNEHDAEHLKRNMRSHVGNVRVDVELVPTIERTVSGKFRAVVSLLHRHGVMADELTQL